MADRVLLEIAQQTKYILTNYSPEIGLTTHELTDYNLYINIYRKNLLL